MKAVDRILKERQVLLKFKETTATWKVTLRAGEITTTPWFRHAIVFLTGFRETESSCTVKTRVSSMQAKIQAPIPYLRSLYNIPSSLVDIKYCLE